MYWPEHSSGACSLLFHTGEVTSGCSSHVHSPHSKEIDKAETVQSHHGA